MAAASAPANRAARGRWGVVAIFFIFMLLHQADKLMIGPLTDSIIDTFHISYTQMGAVSTGALIVGAVLYPLWGWLNDKYNRAKLLSLASAIWGITTWFGAIAPTYPLFVAARASTGIDDSSYPGLYTLVADYFSPKVRGKVFGILQLSQPIGYLFGMVMALLLAGVIGWRSVFYITGSLGIVMAIVIFFFVKDMPRGASEEELSGIETGKFKFSWKETKELFKKKSLILLFIQGFFGVFPWNVITFFIFTYLSNERGYSDESMLLTMAPTILILAAGYPIGGFLGDRLFKKTKSGRAIVAATGVIVGAFFLYLTMNVPVGQETTFMILLMCTALFIPFASPNVLSTVYDITLPEIRSTANSIQYFIESAGAALSPLIAGIIADGTSLQNAILVICISTWILCFLAFLGCVFLLPKDINDLHNQLLERAAEAGQQK